MIQLVVAILLIGIVIWVMGFIQAQGMDIDMVGFGLTGTRGAIIYFASVGVFFAGAFFFVRSLMHGKLSALVMTPLMKLPVIGRWLQLMSMSRMAWALGMSVESGMAANNCVEVALRSTQNRYFTQHKQAINSSITRGDSLHDAFSATGAFSQDFLDAVGVGEETGRLGESMATLSRQYEEQAKVAMQAMAIAGGVGVWVLVAAIIIFFIFRFALFYVGLLNSLMDGSF
jgi:type II secretory pathway component PulF